MGNELSIPDIVPPDYSKTLTDFQPKIPEKYEQQYSAPELVAKVKRKTIKGRVDGN